MPVLVLDSDLASIDDCDFTFRNESHKPIAVTMNTPDIKTDLVVMPGDELVLHVRVLSLA